jgi:hypothetical protein
MLGTVALHTVRLACLAALPFLLLVRGALYLHQGRGWHPWPSLLAGAGAALLLVIAYGAWLSSRVSGRARVRTVALWVATPLVLAYCGYSLLYLSSMNAKSDDVRAAFTAAHPLLRLAVSTLLLADRDAVLTDISRVPADYARMDLNPLRRSSHYVQPDGWVHAVDLRTAGRGAVGNWMLERYFRVMGLETWRHVGTADHLHVQLKSPQQ